MKKKDLERRLAIIEDKLGTVNETPKLEVGKWYWVDRTKVIPNDKKALVYYQGNGVPTYGFDHLGIHTTSYGCHNTFNNYDYRYDLATPQEVEKALIEEAKRRGLVDGVRFISPNGEDWDFKVTSNDFHFDAVNNTLSFTQHLGGTVFLFVHGNWAEVIEQPTDKFAELKEAHKNGAVIQCKNNDGEWIDINEPLWVRDEYRIKPEEKPKVGDVVKVWCRNEDHYVVGKLMDINTGTENKYGVHILGVSDIRNTIYYANAKPLTKEEVIKLLFGDEQDED